MILNNSDSLTFNEAIIDSTEVKLFFYTHESGELVLMASLDKPKGHAYFSVYDMHLHLFIVIRSTFNICLNLQLPV